MPIKVKQQAGDGTEVEVDVFTSEELETQKQEASATAVAAEQERLGTEHEAALAAKEVLTAKEKKELEDLRTKDFNFKKLRDQKTLTPEQEAEAKKVSEDIKTLHETVAAIQKQPFETAKTNFVKDNVGADKELGEKFEFFFKKLGTGVKTIEEQQVALESAMTLATGTPYRAGNGNVVRTSVNADFGGVNAKPESQDSQNFGKELNITTEDKKTFSKVSGMDLLKPTPPKEKNA